MFMAKSLLWTAFPIMKPYSRPQIPQVLKNAAVTHVWFCIKLFTAKTA